MQCLVLIMASFFLFAPITADGADSLTQQETAWLKRHPVLRVGVGRAFPPFMWMDETEQFNGMVADYLALLEDRLPIRFEVAQGLAWKEVVEKARLREIDMFACAVATEERKSFMLFTQPYLSYPLVIITRRETTDIHRLADLDGKTVALNPMLAPQERLLREQPGVVALPITTVLEGLEAVSFGKADAHILNLAVASHLISRHGLTNLVVAARTDWETNDLAMAVRNDWPILQQILQKGLASITTAEHNEIQARWLPLLQNIPPPPKPGFPWLLAGALLVALAALALAVRTQLANRSHRRTIASLERSLNEYRELIEDAPVGIFRIAVDGSLLRANSELARMAGYDTPEEALEANRKYGNRWFADPKLGEKAMELLLEQGRIHEFEYQAQNRMGESFWVLSSSRLVQDASGTPVASEGFVVDIDRRKRSEMQLRESELKFRSIFHSVTEAVSLFDAETGRFLDVNEAWTRLYGYTAKEAAAMHVDALSADSGTLRALWREMMQHSVDSRSYRRMHKTASGVPFPVEVTLTHFAIAGRPVICGVTRPQPRPADDAGLSAGSGRATASLLTATAETLAELVPHPERPGTGPTLEFLAENLKYLALIGAGTLEWRKEPLEFQKIVQQACNKAAAMHPESPGLSCLPVPEVSTSLLGDAGLITRMLTILTTLAMRHGKQDVATGVMVETVRNGQATVKLECRSPGLQLPSATLGPTGNTPDIALLRTLADSLHGRIWSENAPGASTPEAVPSELIPLGAVCVSFTLPVVGTEAHPAPAANQKQDASGRSFRLLLVEDSEYNVFVLRAYLKDEPVEVDVAVNGQEGVELFQRNRYDLVLMDMQMPVMDGYAATEAMRLWEREHDLPQTPIIAVTAHAMAEDTERCIAAGCTVHLAKPVKKQAFLDLIRSYLPSTTVERRPPTDAPVAHVDPDLAEIAPAFLDSVRDKCSAMADALEAGDMETIKTMAHQLKGEGAAFGFDPISRLGASLQKAAAAGDAEAAADGVAALQRYVEEVVVSRP